MLGNPMQHCKGCKAKWVPLEVQWGACLVGGKPQSLCWPKLGLALPTLGH